MSDQPSVSHVLWELSSLEEVMRAIGGGKKPLDPNVFDWLADHVSRVHEMLDRAQMQMACDLPGSADA